MSDDIKSYIDNLFSYIDVYENRGGEFETEGFLQTYNGVYAVFNALAQQRDKAVDVDQFFLGKIQQIPVNASDLRQLTIQILISFFEGEADTDGQSNQSYMYVRGRRENKRDVSFFEKNLMPVLFKDGALHNNFRLNKFFLKEIGRYLNKFGSPLESNITPEAFNGMADHMKLLDLQRRRLTLGEDLLKDRNSLEFDLQRLNIFNKLSEKDKLLRSYFSEWGYHEKGSFFDKLKNSLRQVWGKFKGAFSNYRYLRLVMTQRSAAYVYYGLIIIIFILLAIYVPQRWNNYSDKKYEQLQERANKLPSNPQ